MMGVVGLSAFTILAALGVVSIHPQYPISVRHPSTLRPGFGWPGPGTIRTTVGVAALHRPAVRAPGVLPADGKATGGALSARLRLLTCGGELGTAESSQRSGARRLPTLRCGWSTTAIPKQLGRPGLTTATTPTVFGCASADTTDQIVVAGDSACGLLSALLWLQRLQQVHEEPAALVAISPLWSLAKPPKQSHPTSRPMRMFPARHSTRCLTLVRQAARKHVRRRKPEQLSEPLDHVRAPDCPGR